MYFRPNRAKRSNVHSATISTAILDVNFRVIEFV
ncbi:hypothetical protein T11_14987 [Trichinella zimbabwensis]|uniref:Uncharacterized protein n=1 Tax=Trichinella zimbabwensis TaxID=268475 RepID=A0A0V1G913_9BILA|nr:hypothetical protein T11_14987 [Trichinella zimbabwensis]